MRLNQAWATPVSVHGEDTQVIEGEGGDIARKAVFTLVFCNVGALAPSYEKAVMSVKVDSSHAGSNEEHTKEKTFSGGPNGTLTIDSETLSVVNGSKVVYEGGT